MSIDDLFAENTKSRSELISLMKVQSHFNLIDLEVYFSASLTAKFFNYTDANCLCFTPLTVFSDKLSTCLIFFAKVLSSDVKSLLK